MSFIKESTAHLLLQALKRNGVHVREPFYHATGLKNGLLILHTGFKAKAGGEGNDAYYDNAVCFTRNFDYTQSNIFGGSQIVFVLDRSELKTKYKIYPYNWFFINSQADDFSGVRRELYKAWVRGASRAKLIEISQNTKFHVVDPVKEVERAITIFKAIKNKVKYEYGDWEYEERVSTSNPLTDGVKETYISSSKYIKAILVKDISIANRLFEDIKDLNIPIFFYNYKEKSYQRLNSFSDIARIPDDELPLSTRLDLANDSNTPLFILEKLSFSKESLVLMGLIQNKASTAAILNRVTDSFIKEPEFNSMVILENLLYHKNINPELIAKIWEFSKNKKFFTQITYKVLRNSKTSSDLLEEIYHDFKNNPEVNKLLMLNPNTPTYIKAVVENENMDTEIIKVIRKSEPRVLISLLDGASDKEKVIKVIKDLADELDNDRHDFEIVNIFMPLMMSEKLFSGVYPYTSLLDTAIKLGGINKGLFNNLMRNMAIPDDVFIAVNKNSPYLIDSSIIDILSFRDISYKKLEFLCNLDYLSSGNIDNLYEHPKIDDRLQELLHERESRLT